MARQGVGLDLRSTLLGLSADQSLLAAQLPVLEIWRQYADAVTGEAIRDCGHFIPDEAPDPLLLHLRDFLRCE